ncbi:MAG: methyl-accepting chemotaxis protein [Treponema sp.]|nr:methyl-accepting chemotaxis protein [Treponema sp.]
MNFLKKIFRQGNKESFSVFVYRTQIILDIPLTLFTFIYTQVVFPLPRTAFFGCLKLLILCFLICEVVLSPITTFLITGKLSDGLEKFQNDTTTPSERSELLNGLLQYPFSKSTCTFIYFVLSGISLSCYLYFRQNLDFKIAFTFFLAAVLSSFYALLFTYTVQEVFCYPKSIRIVKKGLSQHIGPEKRHLGKSLTFLFLAYVVVPFLICSALSFLNLTTFQLDFTKLNAGNGNITKFRGPVHFILLSIANIVFLALSAFVYFRRIKKYSETMQKALLSIKNSQGKKTGLIPLDLSTEISYTIYLVNQTIMLFSSIISQAASTNEEITVATQNLSSIAEETAATAIEQTASVKEIIATMESADKLSKSIGKKIVEVNNVARKTSENIDFDSESITQNLEKMREITDSNQTSILGMQSLSGKIKSIWDIVNLIDGVADQTKIIAFNAELEAESISEGKDKFKNVARDIRTLADNVIQLTKEIRGQILKIQDSSNELIHKGQDCTDKIKEGNDLTVELEEKFRLIKDSAFLTQSASEKIQSVINSQSDYFSGIVQKLQQIGMGVEKFNDSTRIIAETVQNLRIDSNHLSKIKFQSENQYENQAN